MDELKKFLNVLSPRNLELAQILFLLRDTGEGIQGIWDEAETEITERLKEIV